MEGEETRLKVEVLSYTRDIKQCKIRSMNQIPESAHRQCQISSVAGTPPNLTLTVRLDSVSKQKEGQWRLELTNDVEGGWMVIVVPSVLGVVIGIVIASVIVIKKGIDVSVIRWMNTSVFWNLAKTQATNHTPRHGIELTGSKSTEGQIRHTFHPVKCEDAGTIRCEAPAASQNKSVQLLVKCPPIVESPEKEVRIMEGKETKLKVEVLSYTRDINQCKIRSMNQMPESAHRPCEISSVSGTLPYLTLTVRLDNVRKEDEGQWQLELTNDAGTAHYKFFIEAWRQDEAPVQNDTLSESDDDNSFDIGIFGEHTFIIIVAIGGGVVIVIVISITVAVILVKRGAGGWVGV
nr:hypothetical protein BaRGS_026008 [Batillaria attramentaria]